MATLFDVLGVPITATDREIKKAYKELALKHHPDKGGDAEVFKKVTEAYDILADEEHRESYIQLLHTGSHFSVLDQFVRTREAQAERDGIAKPSSKYERTCRLWAKGKCNNPGCLYRHYKTAETDKYKVKKVCHDFARAGYCRFGDECQFQHPAGAAGGQNDQESWIKMWLCNDTWSGCKASNSVLDNPRRCAACGAKRKLARCKYPPGTVVQLTATLGQIINAVLKKTLFFSRDGVYRKQMAKHIAKMQATQLHGQMVPTVATFYPSANCYHCVFQDGSYLIVPAEFLKRGMEKWTCEQCKYQNQPGWGKCGLCGEKNPNPVEDWTPFCGTWKSEGGKYFLLIEDHNVSSSDASHYYSGIHLQDGVLQYQLTLVDDDMDDDLQGSSDEEDAAMPEELGTVSLRRDGPHLRGTLRLRSGNSQTTTFVKMQAADLKNDEASEDSSSFDSAESTPKREARKKKRAEDRASQKQGGAAARRDASATPDRRRKDRRSSRSRSRSPPRRDRSRDRDRERERAQRERSRERRRDGSRDRDRYDRRGGGRDRDRDRDRDRYDRDRYDRRSDRDRYARDRYDRDRGRRR